MVFKLEAIFVLQKGSRGRLTSTLVELGISTYHDNNCGITTT